MDKFAVIDTETNWKNETMSIGVVIAQDETFEEYGRYYFILIPEIEVLGRYTDALSMFESDCDVHICSRERAIERIKNNLQEQKVENIFAYNAAFDYKQLPELGAFNWHDIMSVAAYRQYNPKIRQEDCFSTGRLKYNRSAEDIVNLLNEGMNYIETHNAIQDATDELRLIMKPLGYGIASYPIYQKKV